VSFVFFGLFDEDLSKLNINQRNMYGMMPASCESNPFSMSMMGAHDDIIDSDSMDTTLKVRILFK
jgi:hypothetical protein